MSKIKLWIGTTFFILISTFAGTHFFSFIFDILDQYSVENYIEIEGHKNLISTLNDNQAEMYNNKYCYKSIYETFKEVQEKKSKVTFIHWGKVNKKYPSSNVFCSYRLFSRDLDENIIGVYSPIYIPRYKILEGYELIYSLISILIVILSIFIFIYFPVNLLLKKIFYPLSLFITSVSMVSSANNFKFIFVTLTVVIFLKILFSSNPKHYLLILIFYTSTTTLLLSLEISPLKNDLLVERPDVIAYENLSNKLMDKQIFYSSHLSKRNLLLLSPKSVKLNNDENNFSVMNVSYEDLSDDNYQTILWINTNNTASLVISEYDLVLNSKSKIKISGARNLIPYYRVDQNTLYFLDINKVKINE